MHCYFLSQNDASNISIALYCEDCPKALRMLHSAMRHISDRVRPLLTHPLAFTTKEPAELKAFSVLARAAAQVAREFWTSKGVQ